MSQASHILKEIANSPEHRKLVKGIKSADYEQLCTSYVQVSELISKGRTETLDRIQSLPRVNKSKDYQRFKDAFDNRARIVLPEWCWLSVLLKQQGIEEGQVVSFGSKGDPLVRTAEGKIVILTCCDLTQGKRVKFKIQVKGEKVDFGTVVELTPDYFYHIVARDTIARIRTEFNAVKERVANRVAYSHEERLTELSELLTRLEKLRELTLMLRAEEQERILGRVFAYRKRLLSDYSIGLVFGFLSHKEESEIRESCQGDEKRIALILSVPGLFNRRALDELKKELFAGEELRRCAEIRQKLKNKPDDIDMAMELMELRLRTENIYPLVRKYIQKMNVFHRKLSEKAEYFTLTVARERICSVQEIQSAIEKAFSSSAISLELRGVFHSQGEYFSLRAALIELRAILGCQESLSTECARSTSAFTNDMMLDTGLRSP